MIYKFNQNSASIAFKINTEIWIVHPSRKRLEMSGLRRAGHTFLFALQPHQQSCIRKTQSFLTGLIKRPYQNNWFNPHIRLKGPDIKVPQLPKNITATRPIIAVSVKSLPLDMMLSCHSWCNPNQWVHYWICVPSQVCFVIKKGRPFWGEKRTALGSAVRASKQQPPKTNRI